jgi:ElaB/YqjD/DUF883 family membrane-anchored ribosome-binding protein
VDLNRSQYCNKNSRAIRIVEKNLELSELISNFKYTDNKKRKVFNMETSVPEIKDQMAAKSSAAVESMKKSVSKMVNPSLSDKIANKATEYKEDTIEAYDSSINLIRENPLVSVGIATGVGFVIGWLSKRRH